MLRPGLNNSEGRGGMKEKRESKREKGGLTKTWCFKQSYRLFAAAMFNYFRGLRIRGFGGNSHLNVEYSKSSFKHKIVSSPLFEFDTRQNKAEVLKTVESLMANIEIESFTPEWPEFDFQHHKVWWHKSLWTEESDKERKQRESEERVKGGEQWWKCLDHSGG